MTFLERLAGQAGLSRRFAGQAGAELRFVWVTEAAIASMNRRFLAHEGPTDVLAFDLSSPLPASLPGESRTVGEIYVCPAVAARAARKYSTTPEQELLLYMAHGVLHLAGEDDHTPQGRRRMRRLEKRLLAAALDGLAAEQLATLAPA